MSTDIEKMLTSTDPSERREACFAVQEEGAANFVDDVILLLKDKDMGVREAALNTLEAFGGLRVAAGVVPLLKDSDPSVRNIASELLETLGEDSIDPVMNLLHDDNDGVIKMAVDIISIIKTRKPEKALAELINHNNPNVRGAVAICLGKIKANEAKDSLVKALDDNEEWVRFSAADGLGFLGDTGAFDALVKTIDKDSQIVKQAALESLVRISTEDNCEIVLHKLEDVLKEGGVQIPVVAVTEILRKISQSNSSFVMSGAVSKGLKEKLKNFFIDSVKDKSMEVRLASFEGLAILKDVDGSQCIIEYVNSLPDMTAELEEYFTALLIKLHGGLPDNSKLVDQLTVGSVALGIIINVLGEIKAVDAVDRLSDLMFEVGHGELRLIATALGKINTSESVDILIKSLDSRDGHTRKIAALSLTGSDNKHVIKILSDALLREEYKDVMNVMCDSLASLNDHSVKDFFMQLIDNENDALKQVAARGLGSIGGEDILTRLMEKVDNKIPSVRKSVLIAMSVLGLPEGIAMVIKGLKDDDVDVRLAVLKCIKSWNGTLAIGQDKLVKALIDSLSDDNMWVRYQAVSELGELGINSAEDKIIEMLNGDLPPVKCSAVKALLLMRSHKALESLIKLSDHEDERVADLARKAVSSLS